MENVYRSDIYQFFKDMPTNQQQEVISKLNKQIKKPPDMSLQPNYKNDVVSATDERK